MAEPISMTILGTAIGNIISSAVMGNLSAQLSMLNSAVDKLRSGVDALGSVFASSLKEASGYEDAVAGLDAVLKATNNTAGGSRAQLLADAEAYEQATRFSDEMVISAQKVMLTFTNIGATAFPGAMAAAMDLSTVLGQDLQSSAAMVGKALDDPIQGMADLEKAGISFTEEQKNAVKDLVAQGKDWQAQGEILAVLESRFGDAAQAAGGTFSGQLAILKNSFGDLLQTLGSTFLPLLKDLLQWVNEKIMPAFKKWAEERAPALRQALRDLTDWLKEHVMPAVEGFVKLVVDNWPDIQTQIQVAWEFIKPVLEAMGDTLRVMGLAMKLLAGDTQWLSDALRAAWSDIETAISTAWETIQTVLQALSVAWDAIRETFWDIGADVVNGLITGALSLGEALIDTFIGIVNDAVNAIIQTLGIASPSKVFMEIGAQMIAGIVNAITTKATEISAAMGNAISGAVNAVTAKVGEFFSAATKLVLGDSLDGNGGIVGGIRAMVSQIVTEMANAISSARDAVAAKIGEFFEAARALIVGVDGKGDTGLVGGIRTMALQIATEMANVIGGAVTAITNMVSQFYDAAVVLVLGPKKDGEGGIVGGIVGGVGNVETAIRTVIRNAADALATLPEDILNQLAGIGVAVVDGIKTKIAGMGGDLAAALKSAIKAALEEIRKALTSSDNPVAQALNKQINDAIDWLEKELGIASPSKVFAKIGMEMAAGLAQGFATPPLSATLAAGTLAMGSATANAIYNQQHYYNLTIHSNAQTEQVVADFAMLRALAGA